MAMISCPECGKDISDRALTCPNCGCPIEPKSNIQPNDEESQLEIHPHNGSSSKRIYIAIAAIAIIIAIIAIFSMLGGGKVTASNVGTDAIYNTTLGVGVKLGFPKTKVDELLGTPSQEYGWYVYNGLNIAYTDGNVSSMMLCYPNNDWVTKNQISVNSTVDEVKSVYGDPTMGTDNSYWLYYLKSDGTQAKISQQLNHGVVFQMSGDLVMNFQITNKFT